MIGVTFIQLMEPQINIIVIEACLEDTYFVCRLLKLISKLYGKVNVIVRKYEHVEKTICCWDKY